MDGNRRHEIIGSIIGLGTSRKCSITAEELESPKTRRLLKLLAGI
jgi:hypothetical protein